MDVGQRTLNSIALLLLPSASFLLEGADTEWLMDDLSTRPTLSLPTLLILLIILLSPGLLWPPAVLFIPLVFLIPTLIFVLCRIFFYYSSLLDPSTRRLFSSLKARQAAAFSLHMDASRCAESVRLAMLTSLRDAASSISHTSSAISTAVEDEDEANLLISFCTREMHALLTDPPSNAFTSLSSLKTLWDLVVLLRSECLRLVLLSLSSHPLTVLRHLLPLTIRLRGVSSALDAVHQRLHSMSFIKNDSSKNREWKATKLDEPTLVLQLEMVVECLRSDSMNVDGAVRALSQIVSMHSLASSPSHPSAPSPSSSSSPLLSSHHSSPLLPLTERTARDELFESTADRSEECVQNSAGEDVAVDRMSGGRILKELKGAIQERAEEMRERERRVREEQRRANGMEEEEEEEGESEGVVEEVKEAEKMEQLPLHERSGHLHLEIAAALRRRQRGREDIVGDSLE